MVFIKERRKVAENGDLRLKMGIFLNEDCLEGMKRYPDKYFDLAIVDPPYGIKADKGVRGFGCATARHYSSEWDATIPKEDYFDELRRVSKNQIVWGGAIYDRAPHPWDKVDRVG